MGTALSKPDIPEQVTTTPVYHNRTTTPLVLAPTATSRLNSPQCTALARRVQQLNSPERAALARLCINQWKETTLALRYDHDTPVTVQEVGRFSLNSGDRGGIRNSFNRFRKKSS